MSTPVIVAIISAAAAIIVPAISFYLTKSKERQADWQRYKFEMYKEFIESLNGIVGTDWSPDGVKRFAAACNTLHLIASKIVIDALQEFQHETRSSNTDRDSERHDQLLSRLVWEIRNDLRMPGTLSIDQFKMRLWTSGVPTGKV